jgi:hypothetical protein
MWTPARLADGTDARMDWGADWIPAGGYGMAWAFLDWNGHRYVEHGGETPGFVSAYVRSPDSGLTVILLTNRGMMGAPQAYPLAHRILRAWQDGG